MAKTLPYHTERDGLLLSLKFLNPERDRIADTRADFEAQAGEETRFVFAVEMFNPGTEVYALYTAYDHPRKIPEGWESEIPEKDLPLVDAVINTFWGVSQDWEAKEDPLNWYKKFDPTDISDALGNVEWRQRVPVVGGEIISELIKKHSLPNANHRTAIAFLRTYLDSIAQGSNPDLPAAGTYEGEWHEWAENYVHESKRLLLLRRKTGLLRYAKNVGFNEILRKSGVRIDLNAYDFEGTAVGRSAEETHRDLCVRFVEDVLERSDVPELKEEADPGKRAFVEKLS